MPIESELDVSQFDAIIDAAIAEDLGQGGDITSRAVIPPDVKFAGVMAAREVCALLREYVWVWVWVWVCECECE